MRRRHLDVIGLAAIVAAAALLRFHALGAPSLWLDEILHVDILAALTHQPFYRWVRFESENGALFYATQLAGRLAAAPEVAARIAPAITGVVTVIVAWIAARSIDPPRGAALVFALLVAASPLHVYYSREGRPYALLMLAATALLALLGSARHTTATVIALVLTTAIAATAAPILLGVTMAAAVAWLIGRERAHAIAAGAAALCTIAVPLLYHAEREPAMFRPLEGGVASKIAQSFSVVALDTSRDAKHATWLFAALAVIGAIALVRRDRVRGTVAVLMAVLPLAFSLAALTYMHHWYAPRYVCVALPAYLLLVAIGITALLRFEVFALVAALLLAREGLTAARSEPFEKLDWRTIAATIHTHAAPGDLVMTTNDWSRVSLGFYLRRLPPRVRLIDASEAVAGAEYLVAHNTPAWIVTAGYHVHPEILGWACRYPVVLASPRESFRMHYAPSLAHFLAFRAQTAAERAFAATHPRGVTLAMGPESQPFLVDGFGDAERVGDGYARWVIGTRATIVLPPGSRTLTIRALAHGEQSITIGSQSQPMTNGWRDYVFHDVAPGVVTLEFSQATSPGPNDRRPLAAMIDTIANGSDVVAVAPSPRIGVPTLAVRAEPHAKPKGPSLAELNRDKLAALLGRLGFDPVSTIPLLARGELRLEDLAATLAAGSDCLDDDAFVQNVFATLAERHIDGVALHHSTSALRRGVTRDVLVRRILDSGEVRAHLR